MTPRQQLVLDYVREYIATAGYSPSMSEIADKLGSSRPNATGIVNALVADGHLIRASGKHRALRLPGVPDLRLVPTGTLRAELGRRGVTLDALSKPELVNWGRRAVTCAADCCQLEVVRGHLFCRRHWFSLPYTLRNNIMGAFGRRDEAEYGRLVTEARDLIDMGQAA